MYFEITLENGKITTPDSIEITRESTRERYWIKGQETLNIWDDEYLIWGNVTGVNARGEDYSIVTTDSLYVNTVCKFILDGTIEITVGNRPVLTLDYGDGQCDAIATLCKEDLCKDILLRYRRRFRKI